MLKYKIRVTGSVEDVDKEFKCVLDLSISNGGSVENIGKAIQSAVDTFYKEAVAPTKENKEQE